MIQPPLSPDQIATLFRHLLSGIGAFAFAHLLIIVALIIGMMFLAALPRFISIIVVFLVIAILLYLTGF